MESGVLFIAYVTHSRLASNAVVSSLFDGASTHRTIYPLLDARSDPNVVNLASIVHTLIGTARVSDYLHFFCKVYKYWNLHSGILWSSHKYLSPPIHHLIFLQGSTGFTAFLGNSYIFPFFCSKYPSLIT